MLKYLFFSTPCMAQNKDSAIASFVLGLLSFIPLLNWVISLLAVYFGVRALLNIRRAPDQYGGMALAIIGTVIGVAVFFFNATWVLFFADYALYSLNLTVG